MRIDGIKMLSTAVLFCSASTLPLHTLAANYPGQGGYIPYQYPAYYGYKPRSNYQAAWSNPYYGYAYQRPQHANKQAMYQRKINSGYPIMAYHRPSQGQRYKSVKPRYQTQKHKAKPVKTAKYPQKAAKYQQRNNNSWSHRPAYNQAYQQRPVYWQGINNAANTQQRTAKKQSNRPVTQKPRVMKSWVQTKPQVYRWNYTKYYAQPYYWPTWQANYSSQFTPQKAKLKTPAPQKKLKPQFKQVSITEKGFMPARIKVNNGDRVVWANVDVVPHQVNSRGGWKSKILTRGATYVHTFSKPGVYKYYSASNPKWSGQVLVQ